MPTPTYTLDFSQVTLDDVARVGGKNAALGELFNVLTARGVDALDGFATTSDAYWGLMATNDLGQRISTVLSGLVPDDVADLERRARTVRDAILATPLPFDLRDAILDAYRRLGERLGKLPEVAVRSSATAEDLPGASFAGQQETYLNVRGEVELLDAVHRCYASLYTDRAIDYRIRNGFDHAVVALSIGVQPMVRSDVGSAGVIFTLDPESGFRDVVVVTGSYGLGELVVQGSVTPDEWTVFKGTLDTAPCSIIGRRLGAKERSMSYAATTSGTEQKATSQEKRGRFCLSDADVLQLARWACTIEHHFSERAGHARPMDIEWARDGVDGKLYILQARPETVHSNKPTDIVAEVYRLTETPGVPRVSGQAVGEKIAAGPVRVVRDPTELGSIRDGDILVASITDPDWEPAMKHVAAIVTDKGGRTAHAAIVSREMGIPCVVGTGAATSTLRDGEIVTVSCAEGAVGHVYAGSVDFTIERVEMSELPRTRTPVMMNVGDPTTALKLASLPAGGVGLARMEFIIASMIGMHPMALVRYPQLHDSEAVAMIAERIGAEDPRDYFIRMLSEGIGTIAAAFYPRPVIVRMSDFKTNEYARLIGGAEFEPTEENPMLGFRGASRYYDPRYRDGFTLECAAMLRVRSVMGLTNVKVMIPFCRTVDEAWRVIDVMRENGLRQGDEGLEIYAMCEVPSNVVSADAFLQVFDGYSIGSNDLTQLVLGLDRDSGTVAHLFDERNDAVRDMIAQAIAAAHRAGKPIGICGQAPSDHPDFAAWLVEQGVSTISVTPDALLRTIRIVASTETSTVADVPTPAGIEA